METTEEPSAETHRGGGGVPPSRVTLRADTEEEAAAVETEYIYTETTAHRPPMVGGHAHKKRQAAPPRGLNRRAGLFLSSTFFLVFRDQKC
ncbi:hypothetical protein TCDM_07726 [Trypanosoma cruzi Dm28c]|uniref:Uncharacterized protein n=1 Tax=Trypanosoma cruzi Dm28c TaxID=1416333 RepID=V5D9Z9_TRYCR|nr:hypothetical protein TCDM_07726 [Trypanosoma cruzi Dm28c]